jgi:cytochrome c oxidase subunit 2
MAFHVIALSPSAFETWLAERTRPRPETASAGQRRGAQLFLTAGCPQCHAVRGTPSTANAGPDLTHMGSRGTIGAAMLPNTHANLAGWIANPQAIKPGAKMPRTYLAGDDLLDLAAYLESLK